MPATTRRMARTFFGSATAHSVQKNLMRQASQATNRDFRQSPHSVMYNE